jgi:transposase-like protein
MEAPETLQKAIALFSDPQKAFETAVEFRWPGGNVTCPRCGKTKHSFIKSRRLWFCYVCKKQFTVKVGTVMEDSPISLDKWMCAIWMLANCKNGISSYELAKNIGVRQNTGWFMLQRIRLAMKNNSILRMGQSGGPVEADEAFIGGKPKNMHARKRSKIRSQHIPKPAVFGMLDRETRKVRAKVFSDVKRDTLMREILDQVTPGSRIYTDAYKAYETLPQHEYIHEAVNHLDEYVRGEVHTNGLENFWSLLKRSLGGTYVSVEPFHLERYVDEQAFRYNNRATKDNKLTDADRFALVMSQVAGKRLTYAELTGKDCDAVSSPTAGTGQEEPF